MKNIIIVVGAIIVIGLSVFAYKEINKETESVSFTMQNYSNSDYGISFEYKVGKDGYVLQESTPTQNDADFVKAIVLIPSSEVNMDNRVGGEGPATITINVFSNSQKLSSRVWAEQNTNYSNLNLKIGEVTDVVVGGANAINYMADGLYGSENIVVAHGSYVYVVSGMYIDENSALRKDFGPLVDSIQFIPENNTVIQGKINIDAVCDGALAYMSFPDGASAEIFVKDCKEGKHPEVIERYKQSLNLGDGVEI